VGGAVYPAYYVPAADSRAELAPTGATEPLAEPQRCRGLRCAHPRLDWDAMDEWLEEAAQALPEDFRIVLYLAESGDWASEGSPRA
jgi:hypothetical protein